VGSAAPGRVPLPRGYTGRRKHGSEAACMALQQRDRRHYRYADYLGWPDDVRYELLDGVAIDW